MTYQPTPHKTEGGNRKAWTADDTTRQVLELVLIELQKINVQLALMNDTVLGDGDQI